MDDKVESAISKVLKDHHKEMLKAQDKKIIIKVNESVIDDLVSLEVKQDDK